MAGHSHWAKIKRAKGANDAKRGKLWSKVAKKITGAHWSGPRFFGLKRAAARANGAERE